MVNSSEGLPFPCLLVFDIDGTLLETQRITVPAVQRTLAAYGLPVPAAETVCGFFGQPNERYLEWLGAQIPESHRAEVVDAVNRLELELITAEGCLYPGVRGLFKRLNAQGHTLALCSNGPEDYVGAVVESFGFAPLCKAILARGERYSGKAAMLAEVLSRIRVRPAVMIGDRGDDIDAAHENGMIAVAADYGFGTPQELERADSHAESSTDIEDAIHESLRNTAVRRHEDGCRGD